MSTREALIQKIEQQPDWVLNELSLLIDALAAKPKPSVSPKTPTDLGWPPGYFEETAGSFANEPLERPPQLPFEKREEW